VDFFNCSTGNPLTEYVKQRAADPDVASAASFQTARKWITECLDSHKDCPKQNHSAGLWNFGRRRRSPLPTRVLDLFTNLGSGRVKLHLSRRGERGDYVALSYCWGKTPQVKTDDVKTLNEFTHRGIETGRLPKTLQDAIYCTRQLRIRYLWIDSLCIIQKDSDDKAMEISKMHQIYKSAIVTLSAAIATDCGQGFLQMRDGVRSSLEAFQLPVLLNHDGDTPPLGLIFLCPEEDLGYNVKDFGEEPINTRAWTLQESWLSPRLLIYGAGPLKWQCLTKSLTHGNEWPKGVNISAMFYFSNRIQFFKEPTMPQPYMDMSEDEFRKLVQNRFLRDWKPIVSEFSRRSLSEPDDKLPALSGVAAEFNRLTGDVYLAGLWKGSLPWGLLWHRVPHESTVQPQKSTYRSPSWSWASTEDPISFEEPLMFPEADTQVTVHSASTTPVNPLMLFGKLKEGHLDLTSPMRWMTWPQVAQRFIIVLSESPHTFWDYIIPDGGAANPDFTAHVVKPSRQNSQLLQYQDDDIITGLLDFRGRDETTTPAVVRKIPPHCFCILSSSAWVLTQ
jgi:hypothetical protein